MLPSCWEKYFHYYFCVANPIRQFSICSMYVWKCLNLALGLISHFTTVFMLCCLKQK
jgi:hypothetical protein